MPKAEQAIRKCTGEKFVMPASISVGNEVFDTYLRVASQPMIDRKKAFAALSSEQKAVFIKVNLALQFVKRQNLTEIQKDFILDAISRVSAETFDKVDQQKVRKMDQDGIDIVNKAFSLFSHKDAGDFIEPLNTSKNDEIAILKRYQDLLKYGMQQRKKLVNEMALADRVNIWQTQMAYHIATANLSPNQRQYIVEIIPSIQSIFEASFSQNKDERTKFVDALEDEMFKTFTKMEAHAIFMEVGIQQFVKDEPLSPDLLSSNSCTCRWYCGDDASVCGGGCRIVTGCGPFDTWDCTGRCI